MWQKLSYICNNFFHYSNWRITFLNYYTIEKSPYKGDDNTFAWGLEFFEKIKTVKA